MKQFENDIRPDKVAPFAGAWIEMDVGLEVKADMLSLPLRERGLKCVICEDLRLLCSMSLPLRERGLKSNSSYLIVSPS